MTCASTSSMVGAWASQVGRSDEIIPPLLGRVTATSRRPYEPATRFPCRGSYWRSGGGYVRSLHRPPRSGPRDLARLASMRKFSTRVARRWRRASRRARRPRSPARGCPGTARTRTQPSRARLRSGVLVGDRDGLALGDLLVADPHVRATRKRAEQDDGEEDDPAERVVPQRAPRRVTRRAGGRYPWRRASVGRQRRPSGTGSRRSGS